MLISNTYGKGRVRILRVHRAPGWHDISELTIKAMLQGDFEGAYTHADNRHIVATDTIKNIVNIVAREHAAASPEQFCAKLACRFLERYAQVTSVVVECEETRWRRLILDGIPHPHSFLQDSNGRPTVHLQQDRHGATIRSGITGFTFMKSTGSGWTDFVTDDYTTLPPTSDRILATSMIASWLWSALPDDPAAANDSILQAMLAVFAGTFSHGMQDSLYRMGEAALAAVPSIKEISLACPNRHYLPIDLAPFGMAADNAVFTPVDEPHGQIECTLARS